MEILSPVKDYEHAQVAIQSGCDAIYCAPPEFGARVNASISLEELAKIIRLANCYHVKVYITFNTVVFDSELELFMDYIKKIYQYGADGVLIQDPSLISIIKQLAPQLEIHASTQMNINNLDSIKLVQGLGVSRIVLPREMGINRIKEIKQQTNCEIEVFGHGALCVSYSGLCFDSTLLDQKSANRGRCSQYCRMEQEIVNKKTNKVIRNGHPLNLKDLNTTEVFNQYLEAGVDSFKIEGRLKQKEYVMVNTMNYQALNQGKELIFDPTSVYNRTFTSGRIMGNNGSSLVNLTRPNNNGKLIGTIIDIIDNPDPKFQFYQSIITIKADYQINKLDNLRFVSDDGEEGQIVDVLNQISDDTYQVYSNAKAQIGNLVYRTVNNELVNMADNLVKKYYRRVPIDIYLDIDNRFYVIDNNTYNFELITLDSGDITTSEMIIDKLSQTKNTMFDLNIELNYSNDLNILQKSLKQLKNHILENYVNDFCFKQRDDIGNYKLNINPTNITNNSEHYYFEVRTLEQYHRIRSLNSDSIVIINNIEVAKQINPTNNDYLMIPRVMYDDQYQPYDEIVDNFRGIVVSELGAIHRYPHHHKLSNFTLNTTNQVALQWLAGQGIDKSYLSVELNYDKLQDLVSDKAIVGIYGRIPVMIMDYCPINHNKTDSCGNCRACRNGDYYLHDKLNRKFPLLYEGDNRIGMYANQPVCMFDELDKIKNLGYTNFYITFSTESEEEVSEVYQALINQELLANTNQGSYYKRVL